MLIKGTRWDAAESMLKLLVKDDTIYCDSCGEKYNNKMPQCCDSLLLGTHKTHLIGLIQAIKESNKSNINQYGSNKKKQLRACMSIPQKLLFDWNKIFESLYHEKLIRSDNPDLHKSDVRALMRKFPYLRRCELV